MIQIWSTNLAVRFVDAYGLETAQLAQRHQVIVQVPLGSVQVPLRDGLKLLVQHLDDAVRAANDHLEFRRLLIPK